MKRIQATCLYTALGEGLALAVLFLIDYFGVTEVSDAGLATCAIILIVVITIFVTLDKVRAVRRSDAA